MIRPIFDQKTRRDGRMDVLLRDALEWWVAVLREGIAERRQWCNDSERIVHMFCDAAGEPAHLAAVLFDGTECVYTHMKPSEDLLSYFKDRSDNQIMGLELLAISLGFCTFEEKLRGAVVVVHSDNSGSEKVFSKGTAKSWDHAQLVHQQWLHVVSIGAHPFVRRVPTDDNIADNPSRGDCHILNAIGAKEVSPVLHERFKGAETWNILRARWAGD